jgi:hypothetical protein
VSVAGDAVTPAGRPVIVTATVPVKEFTAVARTLTGEPAAPDAIVSDAGEIVKIKSAAAGGVEPGEEGEEPPPQAAKVRHKSSRAANATFAASALGWRASEEACFG